MSLFRKFFGSGEESSEEESHSEFNRSASDLSLPVDERFTFNFKKNGGKFLYCENLFSHNFSAFALRKVLSLSGCTSPKKIIIESSMI